MTNEREVYLEDIEVFLTFLQGETEQKNLKLEDVTAKLEVTLPSGTIIYSLKSGEMTKKLGDK